MVPEKRSILAVTGTLGALAAALLMASGCAPVSYDTEGDSNAVPAANAVSESAEPDASADPEESAAPEEEDAPELTDEELTSELIAKSVPRMGKVVTDEDGWVLYRFDKDSNKPAISNCSGDCIKVWPAALTDGEPKIEGLDEDLVGTVLRSDGTRQLTLAGWPLYRYIGDKKPGQWSGQKVGGVWWVIDHEGKKNLTCIPEGTPKAVPVPEDDEEEAEADAKESPNPEESAESSNYSY